MLETKAGGEAFNENVTGGRGVMMEVLLDSLMVLAVKGELRGLEQRLHESVYYMDQKMLCCGIYVSFF